MRLACGRPLDDKRRFEGDYNVDLLGVQGLGESVACVSSRIRLRCVLMQGGVGPISTHMGDDGHLRSLALVHMDYRVRRRELKVDGEVLQLCL
jgi:hypothetical protein